MKSVVDICNDALAHLGEDADITSIDPPEGSPQAERCAQLYPSARDTALQMHAWGFATARVPLAPLDILRDGWAYAYAAPSDMLTPQAVIPPGWQRGDETAEFTTELVDNDTVIILTDAAGPTLRYTKTITNPGLFSPLFCEALGWLLASKLAGPTLKGDAGRTATADCYKMFMYMLGSATASDANAQYVPANATPSWIAART